MPDQDLGRFVDLFLKTAFDHVLSIEQQFSLLKKSPEDQSILDEIYRHAHSLKGSSIVMGHTEISHTCRQIQEIVHPDSQNVLPQNQLDTLELLIKQLRDNVEKIQ